MREIISLTKIKKVSPIGETRFFALLIIIYFFAKTAYAMPISKMIMANGG